MARFVLVYSLSLAYLTMEREMWILQGWGIFAGGLREE